MWLRRLSLVEAVIAESKCQLRVTWKVDMAVLRLVEVLERYVLN